MIESGELVESIASTSSLQPLVFSDTGLRLSSDGCIEQKFAALRVSADDVNIKVDTTIEFAECYAGDVGDTEITKAEARILMWLGCDGGKLKGAEGSLVNDLDDERGGCPSDKSFGSIFNLSLLIEARRQSDDGSGRAYNVRFENSSATQARNGTCDVEQEGGHLLYSDHCVDMEKSRATYTDDSGRSETVEDLAVFDYRSIRESKLPNVSWYSSGKFLVRLNSWTGDVTFAGVDTAPSWTMTDGVEPLSGTIGSSGLGLVDKARARLAAFSKKVRAK